MCDKHLLEISRGGTVCATTFGERELGNGNTEVTTLTVTVEGNSVLLGVGKWGNVSLSVFSLGDACVCARKKILLLVVVKNVRGSEDH